ncbi:MAG: hypothetical protein R3257_06950 [bacterium]|nr:hypothetical protein [bacterium]
MKISNSKGAASAKQISSEADLPGQLLADQEAAFFAEQTADGESMAPRAKIHRLHLIRYSRDHIKSRLRRTLTQQLVNGLMIPEVVEGLVEFLADVVSEDPHQAKILGVYD